MLDLELYFIANLKQGAYIGSGSPMFDPELGLP
jgi:hypothetical protein